MYMCTILLDNSCIVRKCHSQHFTNGYLTHLGRVTHICVGKLTIISSDNGLSPNRRQAIIWTNAGILLIGPLGTNFGENWIEIQIFSFRKMHLKMSAKWRPFCLGLNVLTRSICVSQYTNPEIPEVHCLMTSVRASATAGLTAKYFRCQNVHFIGFTRCDTAVRLVTRILFHSTYIGISWCYHRGISKLQHHLISGHRPPHDLRQYLADTRSKDHR